jgi:hypothetical protein
MRCCGNEGGRWSPGCTHCSKSLSTWFGCDLTERFTGDLDRDLERDFPTILRKKFAMF